MDEIDKQFEIFRKYYSKLETLASTCVTSIASKLYSNNLISEDVQDQVATGGDSNIAKASKVLHNVKQQIKVHPEKLERLVEVLKKEPAFDDLAKEIMRDIELLHQEDMILLTTAPSDIYSRYKAYLRNVYDRDPIARDDKLAISPCEDFISLALIDKQQHRHHEYRLKISPWDTSIDKKQSYDVNPFSMSTFHGGVDQILASKTPLELDALVTPGSPFVLVEGPPGIGKSTMCWELCRKWETLKSLQDFKIVLQLKLREKRVQNATSLHQLFYHDDRKLCEGIVDLVLSCDGEGVLLVLDGFDELPSSVVDNNTSLIMRLIRGQCLPKATSLVTSRPSAFHHKDCFPQKYQHVEILGFTDEHKNHYAEKAFETEPEILARFKKFIFSNPIITSLMYIPVNCAIIAQVYKDLADVTVPKTMTQLYTLLVLVLIRRHLIQTGRWTVQSKVPVNLESLPEDIKTDLMKVSELAYAGVMKKDIMFSDEDVGESFQHLGLLNEAKEMYVSKGAVTYYSFLHLSIQEFLAAWHVKCHPTVTFTTYLELSHGSWSLDYSSFGRFMSGMCSKFTSFLSGKISVVRSNFASSPPFIASQLEDSFVYAVSCCYEAQSTSCFRNYDDYSVSISTPLDMYMFGYVLVHAPIKWTLEAKTSLDMLASSIADHAPDGKVLGSIEHIHGSASKLDSLPKCLLESLINIPLYHDTVHVIPSLSNLQAITLCYSDATQHVIKSLWGIGNLKMISIEIDDNCNAITVRKDLCHFLRTSRSLLAIVICNYTKNMCGQDMKALWNVQKVVEAALSCTFLTCFITTVPFSAFRLPNYVTDLTFMVYDVSDANYLEMVMNCLCSIACVCKSMSKVKIHMGNKPFVHNDVITFLALLNNSLHSNPSLDLNLDCPFCFSLSDLPFLSSALRKDPDAVRLNLRKSKSLPDLTTPSPFYSKDHSHSKKKSGNDSIHCSCPDLLEMQSLHSMHSYLHEAIGSNVFYYDKDAYHLSKSLESCLMS